MIIMVKELMLSNIHQIWSELPKLDSNLMKMLILLQVVKHKNK